MRVQRNRPAQWLTALNMLGTAIVLSPVLFIYPMPTSGQLLCLAAFGIVQLAVPYLLMARGLRHVPSFEAGLLTVIEPVLNPLWAYIISPDTETPTVWTVLGGAMILGTLAARYWPAKR